MLTAGQISRDACTCSVIRLETHMLSTQSTLTVQFVTLLAVLEPIGHLTMFMAATSHLDPYQKRFAALISVGLGFIVLALFGIGGLHLLRAMGISLLAFQIAGGMIMLVFATGMVLGTGEPVRNTPPGDGQPLPPAGTSRSAAHKAVIMDLAIYPLCVPIIAGPAAILSIVVLMDHSRNSLLQQSQVIAMLGVVLGIMLLAFLFGEQITRVTGEGCAKLLRRVLGMVLAAAAVNMTLNAVSAWLGLPHI